MIPFLKFGIFELNCYVDSSCWVLKGSVNETCVNGNFEGRWVHKWGIQCLHDEDIFLIYFVAKVFDGVCLLLYKLLSKVLKSCGSLVIEENLISHN